MLAPSAFRRADHSGPPPPPAHQTPCFPLASVARGPGAASCPSWPPCPADRSATRVCCSVLNTQSRLSCLPVGRLDKAVCPRWVRRRAKVRRLRAEPALWGSPFTPKHEYRHIRAAARADRRLGRSVVLTAQRAPRIGTQRDLVRGRPPRPLLIHEARAAGRWTSRSRFGSFAASRIDISMGQYPKHPANAGATPRAPGFAGEGGKRLRLWAIISVVIAAGAVAGAVFAARSVAASSAESSQAAFRRSSNQIAVRLRLAI